MEETVIIIMEKDIETGILQEEIATCNIYHDEKYIDSIFAEKQNGCYTAYVRLSSGIREIDDWEFDAIYDYYDDEVFENIKSFSELEDCNTPTWEITFDFFIEDSGISALEKRLNDILKTHIIEMESVFEAIKDKKNEYVN